MKEYTRPSIEVIDFETTDIIQTSGTLVDGGNIGDFTGGGANAGWGTSTASETKNLFD